MEPVERLVVYDDAGHVSIVPVLGAELTIGRDAVNALQLSERNVSRRHARLVRHNGSYMIEDLGSYNGVRINGQRVESQELLKPGDRMSIGDFQIEYRGREPTFSFQSADLAAGGALRLVALSGTGAGSSFLLRNPITRIGRGPLVDIWIDDESLSLEHCEIKLLVEGAEVRDLQGGNAVQINGTKVSSGELHEGDMLEIGNIQFCLTRGSGESITAPALEVEVTSEPLLRSQPTQRSMRQTTNWVPYASALALVLIAAAGFGYFNWEREQHPSVHRAPVKKVHSPERRAAKTGSAAVATPTPAQRPAPREVGDTPAAESEPSDQECLNALDDDEYAKALRAAQAVLKEHPDHAGASACQARALALVQAQQTIAAAEKSLNGRSFEATIASLTSLDPHALSKSLQRRYQDVIDKAASQNLEQAYKLLEKNPPNAQKLAEQVLAETRVSSSKRQVAQNLLGEIQEQKTGAAAKQAAAASARAAAQHSRQQAAAAKATAPAAPAAKPATPPVERAPAAPSPAATPAAPSAPAVAVPSVPPSAPAAAPAETTPSDSDSGLAAARLCLATGDNACVIRVLENSGDRSPASLALLIETYQTVGNATAAARHMKDFIARYPNDSRTARYQRQLESQAQ